MGRFFPRRSGYHFAPIPEEALRAVHRIRRADIGMGIFGYNNVRTIRQVVEVAQAGLAKRVLRGRFRLWIQNRDGSGSSQFNFFKASGGTRRKKGGDRARRARPKRF